VQLTTQTTKTQNRRRVEPVDLHRKRVSRVSLCLPRQFSSLLRWSSKPIAWLIRTEKQEYKKNATTQNTLRSATQTTIHTNTTCFPGSVASYDTPSASEMTDIVLGGALSSTHSLDDTQWGTGLAYLTATKRTLSWSVTTLDHASRARQHQASWLVTVMRFFQTVVRTGLIRPALVREH